MATRVYEIETYEISFQRDRAYACLQGRNSSGDFYLVYFTDDAASASNSYQEGTRTAVSYMPSLTFPWFIDLLRNEGPIYAHVDEDPPYAHRMCTSKEPVGEGERVSHMAHL